MTITRFVLMAATFVLCASAGAAMPLALDGGPAAKIVLPTDPTATEQFAAEELQRYVEQISGATLAIEREGEVRRERILIGRTNAAADVRAELGDDEPEAFAVRTVGDDLILAGASDRGTIYAVYDFLEDDLGCRWLGPGEVWEEIPEQATIDVGSIDRVEQPDMKYRRLAMIIPADRGEHYANTLSWGVKQRINIGSGWPQKELPESFAKRGGCRAWMAPHVIHRVLDPDEHFAEHPEWYALRNGKRAKADRGGFQQVCTTNPAVVSGVAHGLDEMFDARPEVDFMGLGQGDGVNFCQCDDCVALDTGELWPYSRELPVITERWMTFCNDVARKLQTTQPGKKVYTLAYHQTFRPPNPETFTIEPNVMVQVVNSRPNYVCFVHRFENENCPHHNKFREGIEQWVEMTPGGVMVYEYNPHSTFCSMPYPAAAKFVDDIGYLGDIGVVGYEGQSSPRIWGTYGINHYAIAKATWDTDTDADALVDDYCEHAFGPAAEPMKRFVRTAEEALIAGDHITEGVWTWMTPEAIAQCREHMDAAHAAAQNADAKVKARLREWEIGFHYGELGSRAWRTAEQALAENDPQGLQEAIDLANEAAEHLQAERETEPHYAAIAGKLTRVYAARWERSLRQMSPEDAPTIDLGEEIRELPKTWRFSLDKQDEGRDAGWSAPDFDDSDWDEIQIGDHWEDQGYDYDGVAWYRTPVTFSEEELNGPLQLGFGGVDAEAWVYLDGKLLTHHRGWDVPFTVEVPTDALTVDEETVLAVRVFDTSNKGGIYGRVVLARPK